MTDAIVPSVARAVTFFEDRAEVLREATVACTAGAQQLSIAGLSALVDDRSVQVRTSTKGARVLQSRVVRVAERGGEALVELRRAHVEAALHRARCAQEEERAAAAEARARAHLAQWNAALAQTPRGLAEARALAEWRASYEALAREANRALDALLEAREALAEATRDEKLASTRYADEGGRAPRWEATLEVQLEADAPHETTVTVTYRTPCALWRPGHHARLDGAGEGAHEGRVALVTYATVWQRTGEQWEGVEARFSTARPARAASAPLLRSDLLAARPKTAEEKKTVAVQAREQAVQRAGAGALIFDLPGVDDGGEARVYRAAGALTLPSDGRPVSVEISKRECAVRVERVAYPERALVAHVRATGALSGDGPLLAGPVRAARGGTLVGRAKALYVGQGERFELGFGPDDALRVRREARDERDTVPIVGTQITRRKITVHVSNLSGAARELEVIERVPVSELSEVEVNALETDGWNTSDKDGFARASVRVPARGSKTLTLVFEVRTAARVLLNF